MKWGFFSLTHITSLIIAIGIIVGVFFLLKVFDRKKQIYILFSLSFFGIGAIIYNLLKWESPLEYLPFHMCSINALLLPIAVITKNKIIGNLLIVWCLGALFALIVNVHMAETYVFDWSFFFYYFPHISEFAIPIYLFAFKHVKLDYRCILSTLLITILIYTGIHFINMGINNYCIMHNIVDNSGELIQVNYMFSMFPSNALLNVFYNIIPHSYWYMFMVFPIVIIYLIIVYLPSIIKERKKHNTSNC